MAAGITNVAVLFGGRTAEHEVSILTAHEAMAVLRQMPGYAVVPVYITKQGRFLTGAALDELDKFADPASLEAECQPLALHPMSTMPLTYETGGWRSKDVALDVDVALPLLHGPNGEDGTLQGLLEMLGIPYAGSGVAASAVCMSKIAMKRMFAAAGLPQVPYEVVTHAQWTADRASALARLAALGSQTFVKPARGGSSIGVSFVTEPAGLEEAIELALRFDTEAVIERAVTEGLEVNCSVRKVDGRTETSALEAVRSKGNFLTYEQKYLQWSGGTGAKQSGGTKTAGAKGPVSIPGHEVPADLPDAIAERVRSLAVAAFDACDCDGVARIDFLLDGDEVLVNEINTLPGSLSFYLWEAAGVSFDTLLDGMLRSAIASARERTELTYSLDRNLLADIEARKGMKSGPA